MFTKFLLRISTTTRRWAIARLRRRKMKDIVPDDLATMRNLYDGVGGQVRQMREIIAATLKKTGAQPAIKGMYLTGLQGNAEGVVIFDMVDGSHCYYADPPGVCCCGDC